MNTAPRFLSSSHQFTDKSLEEGQPQIHQTIAGRVRFYKHVTVTPSSTKTSSSSSSSSYAIKLDGRELRTPARRPFTLPSYPLALAIASEWDAQTDKRRGIEPVSMPLMSLASTAIDQVALDPAPTIKTCLSYLPTDSALFYTSEEDRLLLRKQKQHLVPVVKWLQRTLDISLLSVHGQMSAKLVHPTASTQRIEALLHRLDPFSLSCLQCATMECKSLVLALALLCRYLSLEQARAASRLEEEFQLEIWGVVEGGHDMDRLNNAVSLSSVQTFMGLLLDDQQHQRFFQELVKV